MNDTNRAPTLEPAPVPTTVAESESTASERNGDQSPDESYVRYMESWPDDGDEDLGRFWTFTVRTGS